MKASRDGLYKQAHAAAARIRARSDLRPALGLVLGSGFAGAVEQMELEARIPYSKLPGFPPVGVPGHRGEVLLGKLGGTPVLVLSGRAHFYEGHAMSAVTFGVRVLAQCGVRDVLITNAAGGIRRSFKPGDFMVVKDHINLMGANPLHGMAHHGPERFVDLTEAYDPEVSKSLLKAGRQCGLRLHTGVYVAVCGPSYETPAEIRGFARLGADAVGMSTVPEVIAARAEGLRVAALSCITNPAAGRAPKPLSHQDVLETAQRTKPQAAQLLARFAALHAR